VIASSFEDEESPGTNGHCTGQHPGVVRRRKVQQKVCTGKAETFYAVVKSGKPCKVQGQIGLIFRMVHSSVSQKRER